jgi:hypothetical protein
LESTGTQTDNYRAHRKRLHAIIITENRPRRERGLLIYPEYTSGAGWALAPKSVEVRAMAIDVAAEAAPRDFVQILITIVMPRPPLVQDMQSGLR